MSNTLDPTSTVVEQTAADPLTLLQKILLVLAAVASLVFLYLPVTSDNSPLATGVELISFGGVALLLITAWYGWSVWLDKFPLSSALLTAAVSFFGAAVLVRVVGDIQPGGGFWAGTIAAWALGWFAVERLAVVETRNTLLKWLLRLLIPLAFGAWLLIVWELLTKGFNVPQVLLPSPSAIGQRFVSSTATLWVDFKQTFLKAVLIGYAMGCVSGFLVAILIDRSDFLKRGLLPIGNLVSALPVVGVAPIMVMWFGFDWPSKAAVVVIMTFFPMLVNTIAGLSASDEIQGDLMKTYAASYKQSLFKLRLPQALPFIFNALKINSTLALIGAIVAEFFGTPIVGMGFRISTEVGRMNVDMVWAEIAVAALAGSVFYGLISLLERMLTFWHPSFRN